MPNWIVRSKLQPPGKRRNLVRREAISGRLERLFDARLGLVHAPAGYGKSTFLALWRDELLDRNVPVAWLSLDDYDASLFHFLAYLIAACNEAGFAAGRELPEVSQDFSLLAPSEISAAIVTGLGKCQGEHVVILDDFHRAQSAEVSTFLDHLFEAVPANVHFVISTREVPGGLSLADMRLHDELVEVTQEELRFSDEEIRTYLDYWADVGPDSNWSAELLERTEGWPVALQTVRRWALEGVPIEKTLTQLSGRSSDLSDYFVEQVYDSLPESTQRFLAATSILERVNAELGDLLSGLAGGWETLHDLERRDIFVQSLDRDRNWYRYHRLFSEFLQERLRRSDGVEPAALHRLASGWFRDNGFQTEAMQHALASEDTRTCAELLEHFGGWRYAMQGHLGTVNQVLELIGGRQVRAYPRLWLTKGYLLMRVGDLENCATELDEFARHWSTAIETDPILKAETRIMQITLRRYGDKPLTDAEIRELEDLEQTVPPDDHMVHAARCNVLCAMYRNVGRFDDCIAVGDQAISQYRALGSVYGEIFIYCHEGYAFMLQARLRDAESLYREGHEIALGGFGPGSDIAAISSAFLAEVCYERNRLHEARQFVDAALPHIERADAWLEVYLAAYITKMKLERAAGNLRGVSEVARRARSTATNRGLERLHRVIDLHEADIALSTGDADAQSFTTAPPASSTSPHSISRYLSARVRARQLMNENRLDEAIELLDGEARMARGARRMRSFVSLSTLLAALQWLGDRREAALAAFEVALGAAMFEGLKRPFVDEGELLREVIRDLTSASDQRRGNRLRDAFVAELIAEINAAGNPPAREEHLLSPREREVLRFPDAGAVEPRDRRVDSALDQYGQVPRQEHLRQARRFLAQGRGRHRYPTAAGLSATYPLLRATLPETGVLWASPRC